MIGNDLLEVHVKMYYGEGMLNYQSTPLPPSIGFNTNFHKDATSSPSSKINPAVLFIIVILATLFFVSGLLHLLLRFLTKSSSPLDPNQNLEGSNSDALQRQLQLQQLFNLHDSGLDQAFIDALPVFTFKEIIGPQEHFDCAVCLCEFLDVDKLRLLPMCGHAFHMNCIDTWLLSNSSCPLCRGTLLSPGFPIGNPMFDFDDYIEDDGYGESGLKSVEIEQVPEEEGFPVRLGKFRNFDDLGGDFGEEIGSSKLDARRCFSMGSYQYVVGNADLRVALRQSQDTRLAKVTDPDLDNIEGKKISIGTRIDSYSVSKIWLWSKKAKFASSSEPKNVESDIA